MPFAPYPVKAYGIFIPIRYTSMPDRIIRINLIKNSRYQSSQNGDYKEKNSLFYPLANLLQQPIGVTSGSAYQALYSFTMVRDKGLSMSETTSRKRPLE